MTSIEALNFIKCNPQYWARPKTGATDRRAVGVVSDNGMPVFSWLPDGGRRVPVMVTGLILEEEWEIVKPEEVLADLGKR